MTIWTFNWPLNTIFPSQTFCFLGQSYLIGIDTQINLEGIGLCAVSDSGGGGLFQTGN